MIKVDARQALNFKDNFVGYIASKNESPIFQLHLLGDYNTFFWRGVADLRSLTECLSESVVEICRKISEPLDRLNEGVAQFAVGNEFKAMPFVITPDEHKEKWLVGIRAGDEERKLLDESHLITFARFDVDSTINLPIILWADLGGDENSEIGFSTRDEVPPAVIRLFKNSSRIPVEDSEIEEALELAYSKAFATA